MELSHTGQSGQLKMASNETNVNTIRVLIENHSLTCRQIAPLIDYSKSTTENIMIKNKCTKMQIKIPKKILEDLKKSQKKFLKLLINF